MSSCRRCSKTNSGPEAFLLTCRGCSKTWHHRCLMPPLEDAELVQLIRATTAGDADNGLGAWTCRRCKKAGSGTPSATSSREQTARENSKSATPSYSLASTDTARVTPSADVRAKQEWSTTVDARLVDNRERNMTSGRQESTEAVPVKRTLSAKRTRPSAANHPHVQPQPGPAQPRDADVQMAGGTSTKFTPQEKNKPPQRPSPPTHSHQVKAARKFVSPVSATSTEDDVEMNVDPPTFFESTSRATLRASRAPSSDSRAIRPESVGEAPPYARAASSIDTNERERGVRLADEAAIQPRVNQDAANEIDDDPDDLYGPPMERRIIRILPSLAEELRDQQRRVAAEKEKRRAPLAPDWIFARHTNDPLWKEIPTEGRKRRKPTARKLGDNGLNVNELVGCFTVQNWVREHKA